MAIIEGGDWREGVGLEATVIGQVERTGNVIDGDRSDHPVARQPLIECRQRVRIQLYECRRRVQIHLDECRRRARIQLRP
jgi:hypothetical protein